MSAPQAVGVPRVFIPRRDILICGVHLHRVSGAHEVLAALPCKWGVTDSQLDQECLTPLSINGCGRLQLRAANWQEVDK